MLKGTCPCTGARFMLWQQGDQFRIALHLFDHLVPLAADCAEPQPTTPNFQLLISCPQLPKKTTNLTAVSYGQSRWAVSADFGQRA